MSIYSSLIRPIERHMAFFAMAIILHVIVSVLCAGYLHDEVNPAAAFVFIFCDAYLLCWLAELLSKVKLGMVLKAGYIALAACEIFCIFFYGSPYNHKIIRLVAETTPRESQEFICSILCNSTTWLSAALCVVLLLLSWGIAKAVQRAAMPVRRGLGILMLVLLVVSCALEIPCWYKVRRAYHAPDSSILGKDDYRPYLYTPLVRMGFGLAQNHVETHELQRLNYSIARNVVTSCTYESPKIVLIIGESFSKYHTPLYTPSHKNLPCSPCLEKLRDSGNLVLYSDVVTTSNLTSIVLRNIFATKSTLDQNSWTAHTLFPIVFRQAGYQVVFLSNQLLLRGVDTWNILGGTIFNHPALSEAQFSWRNTECTEFDGDAVRAVPDSLIHADAPTLYIYHLIGQHVEYQARYPESYEQFQAEDAETPYGGEKGRRITAQYANATLYNDHVVDSIWSLFCDQDAIGIYLSDHGEEVYDWRDFYERSDESHINAEIARYQFEIPFMFLLSDSYQEKHPELCRRIREAKDLPYQNCRLSSTLFGLAGIETCEYHPEEDILSEQYDPTLPRPIGTHDEYDRLHVR